MCTYRLQIAHDVETFLADSISSGIEYFAADVTHEGEGHHKKAYCLCLKELNSLQF